MNLRSLSRGRVLRTRITEQWSTAEFVKNEEIEKSMLYTNFGPEDHGMSRSRVCTMNTAHEHYEEYTQLFLHASEMKYLLSKIDRGELAHVRGRIKELLLLIDGGDHV